MSRQKFTLYWSHLEAYEKCPQKFLWRKGWGDIDVGGGPGKRKPIPDEEKRSEHHAVMGIVIQYVIERFYNDQLWKDQTTLETKLKEILNREFNYRLGKHYIIWRESRTTREEMLQVCMDGVFGYLKTVKAQKLLGSYAKSEINLVGDVEGVSIGGRVDMIINRKDTGVTILDGKNSTHKDKYLDPDQLRFYALCYKAIEGKLPDRLGWVYYRFPANKETGETGVSWVPCTEDDIEGLTQRIVSVREDMEAEKFEPTPTPKNCKFCDFETMCPPRIAQRKANSEKRGKKKSTLLKESLDKSNGDFVDFGFDSDG